MSKLELILLGQFECLLPSGTRISLSMRKAEVLLAYLALTPGLRHPRERLINLLWSDRGEEQARNSLRQCLSAIRKSLGEVADLVLQVDRTTVSLIPELVEIDVHEFERLAAEGDYESLTTAAELYQGEFLEGISIRDAASQDWLDNERSRFKRQFIEILSNLAETQLVSHDFSHAIQSAERLVKQDPLGESGWRLLMSAYSAKGDRSHALQAFKRCQQILRDELEVEPESATIELRDQIAGGESSRASTPDRAIKQTALDPASTIDHSIAVLPFDNLSGDPEQEYFSDGITESIILNLSRFPGLQIKSRNSSFAFKQQMKSPGEISRELAIDYIVEGSIRKSTQQIRITVQLIEAANGNQVWGKRYDSGIENLFELEEELSRTVAATITGQVESDLQRIALSKGATGQKAYDLLLKGAYHVHRFNRQDTVIAIEELNQCLAQDPDNLRALVHLYGCHSMSYLERWTEDYHASFKQAEKYIRRAMELDPELALVQAFYAEYLIFCGQLDEADKHLDKALKINPNYPDALAVRALCLESRGEAEAALVVAEQTLQLDPYHPWVEWELAISQYLCGRYETTLKLIEDSRTSPGFTRIFTVASQVKLGRVDDARQALKLFLHICRESMLSMPQTIDEWLQYTRENYPFTDPQINQDIIDCLVQAGLCEDLAGTAGEIPSIAVLPFENMSGDPEQEYFSDGITTDIIATLSRFRHMRTVSRYSTLQYKTEKASIEEIAAQQGVSYILEGSVRKSGERIRVSAALVDSATGQHRWSERYDRDLDDLFALQDEITKSIALALKVQFDDGEMARIRSAGTTDIRAWQLTLEGVDLQDTYIRQNILDARAMFNQAIEIDPDYARAWVSLGWTCWQEVYAGLCDSIEEPMRDAKNAATKALELDPSDGEAWALLGAVEMMEDQSERCIEAFEKAVALEPGNSEVQGLIAFAYLFVGETKKARQHQQKMLTLCPVYPNWFYLVGANLDIHDGNLEQAIVKVREGITVEPESPLCRFYLVDYLMLLGDVDGAAAIADEIRGLDASIRGRGMVRVESIDKNRRERFRKNLETFDLY